MSVNGIWKVELAGLHGWEGISTVLMQDGRYFASSADHYSTGNYEVDGEHFKAKLHTVQHGEVRAIFGDKRERWDTHMEGEITDTGLILAKSYPVTGEDFSITLRMTKLESLD